MREQFSGKCFVICERKQFVATPLENTHRHIYIYIYIFFKENIFLAGTLQRRGIYYKRREKYRGKFLEIRFHNRSMSSILLNSANCLEKKLQMKC